MAGYARGSLVRAAEERGVSERKRRATAAEIGAEIAIVGDPKDHATTDLLERIRKS